MKSTAVLELMTRDHLKIAKLLNEVESSLDDDHATVMKVFDTFKWELEKHFFTEEKALFTQYEPSDAVSGHAINVQVRQAVVDGCPCFTMIK